MLESARIESNKSAWHEKFEWTHVKGHNTSFGKINTKFLGIFELEHQQAVIHMLLSVVQTLDSKNSDVDHEPAKFLWLSWLKWVISEIKLNHWVVVIESAGWPLYQWKIKTNLNQIMLKLIQIKWVFFGHRK